MRRVGSASICRTVHTQTLSSTVRKQDFQLGNQDGSPRHVEEGFHASKWMP